MLNVNVPNIPFAELEGTLITELGVRLYDDRFEKRIDPRGRTYYWLAGQALDSDEAENSDAWAVVNNMVSITPISFNMTDRKTLDKLSHLPEIKTMTDHGKHDVAHHPSNHHDHKNSPREH